MQLPDLCAVPSPKTSEARYHDRERGKQKFCRDDFHEKEDVLQHENQDDITEYVKHYEALEDLPKGSYMQN